MMRLMSRGLVPALLGFAAMAAPALAQQDGFSQQMDDIRNAVGFGRDRPPIDFTERAPLVVPPSNNLPPPVAAAPQLGLADADAMSRRKALTDPRRPVPPSDPGAGVAGLSGRTYLVDPPAGLRNPAVVAADVTTDTTGTKPGGKVVKVRHHHRTPAPVSAETAAQ